MLEYGRQGWVNLKHFSFYIYDKIYSPQMVVTTKYTLKNLTKKRKKKKNQTNGMYLSKLVITQNM